jgi:O-phospho-L-seryl-tRNASec:L-selenocysteinyl-tRNA synthase
MALVFIESNLGRSGDVVANQPKAAGSSLILQLTRYLVVSAFRELNYEFVNDVLVLPLATGMAISLGLLMLANKHKEKKYVIWSRIDQKTCLKAIDTANLIPVVIELKCEGDALVTDLEAVKQKIE